MPSRADVERLRQANTEIVRVARADLDRFWAPFADRPGLGRVALEQYMPILTRRYGELSASVAAEWYDEMRTKAGVSGDFQTLPSAGVGGDEVVAATRWAARPLREGDAATAMGRTSQILSRFVLQPGRDTITQTAGREHVRWARVPSGDKTCAFCLMLASRGFEYTSKHEAQHRGRRQMQDKYHDDCDCIPVPDWSDDPRLDGYDPDDLYARYQSARDIAGTGDTKAILAALRVEEGIH